MKKKILLLIFTICIFTSTCSCALSQKSIDNRTGFLNYLKLTENNIRNEDWEKAKEYLEESIGTWEKIKPLLQIDIDHDYVNSIEDDFVKLGGYIDAKEKGDALATILLIKDTWENIGSL
ncbi:MAG: DUF4363 family protein [Clostridiaceae bacterium]|nr:DUF4363 family protein [Clostridiaceae bacterium]